MSSPTFLTNQLLIAVPYMQDPSFHHTVTYICEHTPTGAMGIIINRPLEIKLGEVLKQMNIVSHLPLVNQLPVLAGGPVGQEQGFIIHDADQQWRSTFATSDEIAITTSRDILQAMAEGQGPQRSLISLGYAGWSAGQLEKELAENFWITVPATLDIVFNKPFGERWHAAAASLGIDINSLSGDIGHA